MRPAEQLRCPRGPRRAPEDLGPLSAPSVAGGERGARGSGAGCSFGAPGTLPWCPPIHCQTWGARRPLRRGPAKDPERRREAQGPCGGCCSLPTPKKEKPKCRGLDGADERARGASLGPGLHSGGTGLPSGAESPGGGTWGPGGGAGELVGGRVGSAGWAWKTAGAGWPGTSARRVWEDRGAGRGPGLSARPRPAAPHWRRRRRRPRSLRESGPRCGTRVGIWARLGAAGAGSEGLAGHQAAPPRRERGRGPRGVCACSGGAGRGRGPAAAPRSARPGREGLRGGRGSGRERPGDPSAAGARVPGRECIQIGETRCPLSGARTGELRSLSGWVARARECQLVGAAECRRSPPKCAFSPAARVLFPFVGLRAGGLAVREPRVRKLISSRPGLFPLVLHSKKEKKRKWNRKAKNTQFKVAKYNPREPCQKWLNLEILFFPHLEVGVICWPQSSSGSIQK